MAVTRIKVQKCYGAGDAGYDCSFEVDLDMDARFGGPSKSTGDIRMVQLPNGNWTYDPRSNFTLSGR